MDPAKDVQASEAEKMREVSVHVTGKPQLVGMAGYARSGKDTVAEYLREQHGYTVRAIATPLKNILPRVNSRIAGLVEDYGWETAKGHPGVREGLQRLGAALRAEFGQEFLPLAAIGEVNEDTLLVISDIRTPGEVDIIHEFGGIIIRVERPGIGPANDDVTEQVLEADYIIANDGTLEDLHVRVETLLSEADWKNLS